MLVVKLRDPASGKLFRMPPGGQVEEGEAPRAAALRELREETGFEAVLDPAFEKIVEYLFDWAGQTHSCRTHFFQGVAVEPAGLVTATEPFLEGWEWMPVSGLAKEWAFHPVLSAALLPVIAAAESAAPARKKT